MSRFPDLLMGLLQGAGLAGLFDSDVPEDQGHRRDDALQVQHQGEHGGQGEGVHLLQHTVTEAQATSRVESASTVAGALRGKSQATHQAIFLIVSGEFSQVLKRWVGLEMWMSKSSFSQASRGSQSFCCRRRSLWSSSSSGKV